MNGYNIDAEMILSDAQALPNATSGDTTNMVNIGGKTGQKLVMEFYAVTDIAIATGQAFNIEFQAYTSDTGASAVSPISNAHVYILHKTSADGALAYSAGDLIAEYAIPENLLAENSYDWVQAVYTTDADESSETINAFIRVVG